MKNKKTDLSHIENEDGFILITTLMMLVLLMVVGISATTTTTLELEISGNDRVRKETFYQADGGTQLAARLIEESLGTPGGFTALDTDNVLVDPVNPNNTILIVDTTLSENNNGYDPVTNTSGRRETSVFDDTAVGGGRDLAYFPGGFDATNATPHTNIIADGVTSTTAGSGLQMVSGYEGTGKGTAGGGSQILYTIYSQHMGRAQSESIVAAEWKHVVGLEINGRY